MGKSVRKKEKKDEKKTKTKEDKKEKEGKRRWDDKTIKSSLRECVEGVVVVGEEGGGGRDGCKKWEEDVRKKELLRRKTRSRVTVEETSKRPKARKEITLRKKEREERKERKERKEMDAKNGRRMSEKKSCSEGKRGRG